MGTENIQVADGAESIPASAAVESARRDVRSMLHTPDTMAGTVSVSPSLIEDLTRDSAVSAMSIADALYIDTTELAGRGPKNGYRTQLRYDGNFFAGGQMDITQEAPIPWLS